MSYGRFDGQNRSPRPRTMKERIELQSLYKKLINKWTSHSTHLYHRALWEILKQFIQIVERAACCYRCFEWIFTVIIGFYVFANKNVFILKFHVRMLINDFILWPNVVEQIKCEVEGKNDGKNGCQQHKNCCPRTNGVFVSDIRITPM